MYDVPVPFISFCPAIKCIKLFLHIELIHFSDDTSVLDGQHPYYSLIFKIVHRCGASGSMLACHAAGPGSIPGRDKFPGCGFFGVFPHL